MKNKAVRKKKKVSLRWFAQLKRTNPKKLHRLALKAGEARNKSKKKFLWDKAAAKKASRKAVLARWGYRYPGGQPS